MTSTQAEVVPADAKTPSRNVRVGRAWDDAKAQTRVDDLSIADVVRAGLDDYLKLRAAGEWPAWLPRP